MATKAGLDEYASKIVLALTESAGSTLTYDKIETGMSIYDTVGWLIQRVEYQLTPAVAALFNGSGDYIVVAMTSTNSLTSSQISPTNPAIYTYRNFQRLDFGTAANGSIFSGTFVDDYSNLSGGGLFVLPQPLYGAIIGGGLTGAASITATLYVKAIPLADKDYFSLVQARQLLINA